MCHAPCTLNLDVRRTGQVTDFIQNKAGKVLLLTSRSLIYLDASRQRVRWALPLAALVSVAPEGAPGDEPFPLVACRSFATAPVIVLVFCSTLDILLLVCGCACPRADTQQLASCSTYQLNIPTEHTTRVAAWPPPGSCLSVSSGQLCLPHGMPGPAGMSALLHCELALDVRLPGAAAPWTTLHMPVCCRMMRYIYVSTACTLVCTKPGWCVRTCRAHTFALEVVLCRLTSPTSAAV